VERSQKFGFAYTFQFTRWMPLPDKQRDRETDRQTSKTRIAVC